MKDKLALTGCISFALGIMLASSYEDASILIWPSILVVVIFIGAWFCVKRPEYAFLVFLFLGISFGLFRFSLFDTGIRQNLESALGTKVELNGRVVADPDIREGTERLTLYVPSEQTKILAVVSRYPGFSYGDLVTVSGKIEHPEPFDTDGDRTFQYDKFLAKDRVSYLMNFAHIQKIGEDHSIATIVLGSLYSIKDTFAEGLQEALPEPASSLAEGILVGGKQGLGKDLLGMFTVTGLLPIIVLSGYNVMIVAEAILLCFGFLQRRFALTVSGIVIILFIILAGSGSSAVRAGIMAVLALFARATGRQYDALRILIFAFVAMLLWNPYQLMYDPGFQFSFMATLGLILLSPHLENRLTKIRSASLREILSSTLSAQLFVLPILLYQTGNLSLVSIPANVLALVAVSPAMLLSFIAGLAGVIIPSCALWIGLPAYVLLSYIILVATSFASLPFAHVIVPLFSPILLLVAYTALAWLYIRLQKKDSTKP
jgi:competence protein ComEC